MRPGRATLISTCPRFELPEVIRQFMGRWSAQDEDAQIVEPAFELASFAVRAPRAAGSGAAYAPRWG